METEYGPVIIIGGKFKGKWGFYDDDDTNGAIVYLFHCNKYCFVNPKHLISMDTPFNVFEHTMGFSFKREIKP